MSQNFRTTSSAQPLSVGNVVSAVVKLYRSHFQQYLGLAFQAILWSIIPIYGWAKFYALHATISRLAFGELVNQPESIRSAKHHINSRFWSFWLAQIIVAIILFFLNFGLAIINGIITGILGGIFGNQSVVFVLLNIVLSLATLVIYLWFFSRIFLPELPLAIEDIRDAGEAIGRSWELTKGHVWRLQVIILIASLITLPIIVLAIIPFAFGIGYFVTLALSRGIEPSIDASNTFWMLIFLGLILLLLANVLVTPFWQAIKAVVYYDLRSRREGLGLKLRDREI
jgi:hypothetical protein